VDHVAQAEPRAVARDQVAGLDDRQRRAARTGEPGAFVRLRRGESPVALGMQLRRTRRDV
jgi:hypothetical protein